MATQVAQHVFEDATSAELTALGVRLEILRIQRGLSKQGLARTAGTSRQQLWRVMTGKSELTTSLHQRLAAALECEMDLISAALDQPAPAPPTALRRFSQAGTIGEYLATSRHLTATLTTLPSGEVARPLKRALLLALEMLAAESGYELPPDFEDIQRRVQVGEL